MNTLIISIGSNDNPEINIPLCRRLLSDMFDHICFSDISITPPYGAHYKNNFSNQLAYARTDKTREETELNFKLLEKQIGRHPLDKKNGRVKIDLDLIKWNDTTLKADEWKRDYICKLLPGLQQTIAAGF